MVRSRLSLATAFVWLMLLTLCTSLPGIAAEHQRGRSGETERRRVETTRTTHDGKATSQPNRRRTDSAGEVRSNTGSGVERSTTDNNAPRANKARESAAQEKQTTKDATESKTAAEGLPRMKGMGPNQRAKVLAESGFSQTKVSKSTAANETWRHNDGSEVRVHRYGNQTTSEHKSANNAHMHKQDSSGRQLTDRGTRSNDPNATHIGLPNPSNLPAVRGRPHGE